MAASQVKESTSLGKEAKGFEGMSKPEKVVGSMVCKGVYVIKELMCTRQLSHKPAHLGLILPISAAPSFLICGET